MQNPQVGVKYGAGAEVPSTYPIAAKWGGIAKAPKHQTPRSRIALKRLHRGLQEAAYGLMRYKLPAVGIFHQGKAGNA